MIRQDRRERKSYLIPGIGLVVAMILAALWIWSSGGERVEVTAGQRRPVPALQQREGFDANLPYRLLSTSWSDLDTEVRARAPSISELPSFLPQAAATERDGLEIAITDR